MRIFELLLTGIISIELAILFFRSLKNQLVRYAVHVLALVLLLSHLLVEGYRWQMIPAYLMLAVILLASFLPRSTRALVVLRNVFLVFLLSLTVFLPTALPVLFFANDGEYAVGVQHFTVVDNEREEVLTKDPTDKREYNVRVFYPTSDEVGEAPYILDFDKVKSAYADKIGWPTVLVDYLRYARVEAGTNASIIKRRDFPLIIYSHGLTNNYMEATGRMMKLASRGYVVAAINHTYGSNYNILSNGEVAPYKRLTILGDPLDVVDSVKSVLAHQWVEDSRSLVKFLKSKFEKETINFNNIALMGFSAGGTMSNLGSYEMAGVRVAINLDGTPRGISDYAKPHSPQLFVLSEPKHYTDAQLKAWGITRAMVEDPVKLLHERATKIANTADGESYIAIIPDTEHSNFVEFPLLSPYSRHLNIGGTIDARECYDMINEMVFVFLDRHLKSKEIKFPEFNEIRLDRY